MNTKPTSEDTSARDPADQPDSPSRDENHDGTRRNAFDPETAADIGMKADSTATPAKPAE